MNQRSSKQIVTRAMLVLSTTLALVGGVTYAALQSQAGIVRGNTIQTAVASLQVGPNNSTFSPSMDGYTFGNLVPGGQPSPTGGYPVFLKNVGTTPLAVNLSVSSLVTNSDNVDLTKVHVILTSNNGGAPHNFTLQDLIASQATGGLAITSANRINPTQVLGYSLQVSMESDAVSGSNATLSNVDFSFGALAVN